MEVASDQKAIEHAVTGGSAAEALGGAAGAILAILGLANVAPAYMVAIASIALGAALLFEGALITTEYSRILKMTGNGSVNAAELGGGLSAEALSGAAAIVLGILALLDIVPVVLMAVSCIILGAGLMLSSGVSARLNDVKIGAVEENVVAQKVAHEVVSTANSAQLMIGMSAAVLGILALIGFAPLILELVAMLAIGVTILLSGTALTGRMLSMFTS